MTSSLTDRAVPVSGLADRPSLAHVFQETAARVPNRVALRTHGDEVSITWGDYARRVRSVAEGFTAAGVKKGDLVALLLRPRPEFHVVDTAALHLGAATVSIYATLPVSDIAYMLADSGTTMLVTEAALLDKAREAATKAGGMEVISIDGGLGEVRSLADLEAVRLPEFDFVATWGSVTRDDLALLVYTSGTTGTPKAVELTHGAILGNQQCLNTANGILDGARVLSYLPMAHVAERHLSHYRPMVGGFTVTVMPDHTQMAEILADFRPEYFFSPPRLYEKFRAALALYVEAAPTELQAGFTRLMELGGRKLEAREGVGSPLTEVEAEELQELQASVGKSILAKVGLDSVINGLTGSAPVPKDLLKFYLSLGMPVLEAWGQSECGAFGAFNTVEHSRVGTVGQALPGVSIKLLDDGEILLKSPWMMRGYRNRPEDTRAVLDADGWLHTGDVGVLSEDGFLAIVDRKKEIIINSFGKNMSPANIEGKLRDADPIISHAIAIGDGRPHISALIVLDSDQLHAYVKALGLEANTLEQVVLHEDVVERVQAAVDRANENLSRVEAVRAFRILPTEWLPASDELTPTMKLRRREIHAKYAREISELP